MSCSSVPTPASLLDSTTHWSPVSPTLSSCLSPSLTPLPSPSLDHSRQRRPPSSTSSPSCSIPDPPHKEPFIDPPPQMKNEISIPFSKAIVKPPPPVVMTCLDWSTLDEKRYPPNLQDPQFKLVPTNPMETKTRDNPSYVVEELGSWIAPRERKMRGLGNWDKSFMK